MRWILAIAISAAAHAGIVMLVQSWDYNKPQAEEPPIIMLVDMTSVIANPDHVIDEALTNPVVEDISSAPKQISPAPSDKTEAALSPEPKPATTSEAINNHPASKRRSSPTPIRVTRKAQSVAPVSGGSMSPSNVPPSWRSALLLHLNKYKRYPAAARQRGITGIAQLQFTMDRSGRVLSYRLVASAGADLLDQETLNMIRRASPLPRIPPEFPDDRLTFTVPVRFSLQ